MPARSASCERSIFTACSSSSAKGGRLVTVLTPSTSGYSKVWAEKYCWAGIEIRKSMNFCAFSWLAADSRMLDAAKSPGTPRSPARRLQRPATAVSAKAKAESKEQCEGGLRGLQVFSFTNDYNFVYTHSAAPHIYLYSYVYLFISCRSCPIASN